MPTNDNFRVPRTPTKRPSILIRLLAKIGKRMYRVHKDEVLVCFKITPDQPGPYAQAKRRWFSICPSSGYTCKVISNAVREVSVHHSQDIDELSEYRVIATCKAEARWLPRHNSVMELTNSTEITQVAITLALREYFAAMDSINFIKAFRDDTEVPWSSMVEYVRKHVRDNNIELDQLHLKISLGREHRTHIWSSAA